MFRQIRAKNGVVYYVSDVLLGVKHGFATRIGGVSVLPHTASLNLAFGRGDGEETVLQNVELLAEAVGFDSKRLVSVPQIHSDRIFTVTEDMCGEGVVKKALREGDGYVISQKGLFAAIKTADCVPVLLCDKSTKACAAVHAGWRGTVGGITKNAVDMMTALGIKKEDILVAIGPCIGNCCYEVGGEVREEFMSVSPEYSAFFTPMNDAPSYTNNTEILINTRDEHRIIFLSKN